MALEIITIRDNTSGAKAQILPGLGFNCFSFVTAPERRPVETLWSSPDFTTGKVKPSRCGIPLLFPFAGRIRGTSFQCEGRTYELPVGDDFGNAIHGFVMQRPWRVVRQEPYEVVGQFQASVDDPTLLARWPADFRITVTHCVYGHALRTKIEVENPDERPLPFGLGTHGYFRVPFGPLGKADQCVVKVPVTDSWELNRLLPTGRRKPSSAADALRGGLTLAYAQLDDVLDGVQFDDRGLAHASIYDPTNARTLRFDFDQQFRACVLFNPPHREAICIEPYTTIPDAFWLKEQGIDPSLKILAPGKRWETKLEVRLE